MKQLRREAADGRALRTDEAESVASIDELKTQLESLPLLDDTDAPAPSEQPSQQLYV